MAEHKDKEKINLIPNSGVTRNHTNNNRRRKIWKNKIRKRKRRI